MVLEQPGLGLAQAGARHLHELVEGLVVLAVVLGKELVQGGVLRSSRDDLTPWHSTGG